MFKGQFCDWNDCDFYSDLQLYGCNNVSLQCLCCYNLLLPFGLSSTNDQDISAFYPSQISILTVSLVMISEAKIARKHYMGLSRIIMSINTSPVALYSPQSSAFRVSVHWWKLEKTTDRTTCHVLAEPVAAGFWHPSFTFAVRGLA